MPIILPANSAVAGGFNVDNSLRFNSGSSDYLNKNLGTPTNNRKWSFSFWVKRAGSGNQMITSTNSSTSYTYFGTDQFAFEQYSGGFNYRLKTNRLFRDFSAWYHIVIAVDTTQGTDTNRVKIYVNGVQETSFEFATYPSQNFDTSFNSAVSHFIGREGSTYFDGYLSEVVLIDGQQLAPTSFGEFDEDSGIWKPIDVSGLTFGNNGFYLDFEDSSALGNDAAGSNNFTVNNLTAIDQSTDTCTTNFAILNFLAKGSSSTFSEGNLKETVGSATYNTSTSTIGVSSGKWYWEYKLPSGGLNYVLYGITSVESSARDADVMTNFKTSYAKTSYAGEFRYNTGGGAYSTDTSGFSADSTGDIVKIALDLDNNFIYVGNGNSWYNSGNPESGASGTGAAKAVVAGLTYFPMMIVYNNSLEINFGSAPYAISSGNADGNGFGNFEYTVPSGYLALCTKNLAENS